jgi:hypothetical protein
MVTPEQPSAETEFPRRNLGLWMDGYCAETDTERTVPESLTAPNISFRSPTIYRLHDSAAS